MVKLAIDMMGSDLGSKPLADAVIAFMKAHMDCQFILVGKKEELVDIRGVETIDARDVVPMTAGALDGLRAKGSSMLMAIDAVAAGKADGIVSAGSTGAYLSASAVKLKKIDGVLRPALATPFPTMVKGQAVTLLDVGASNVNTPEELAQFAFMGSLYSEYALGVNNPKVCLISNGSEPEKGSPVSKEAFHLIDAQKLVRFCGNIEARDVMTGAADVVVMDGFTGNVFLKTSEGTASNMSLLIKQAFSRSVFSKIGYLLSSGGFKDMRMRMNYRNYGGALLIGVNSVVVKAHGNSDETAFYHAIDLAYRLVKCQIVEKLKEGFQSHVRVS